MEDAKALTAALLEQLQSDFIQIKQVSIKFVLGA